MPKIVDMEKLEEQIALFVNGAIRASVDAPGVQGASARGQIAVTTALTRWRAEETNRGTEPNEIANAMVMIFATAIQSVVTSVALDRMDQLAVINRMLKAIGEEIAAVRVGARNTTNYRVERTPGT